MAKVDLQEKFGAEESEIAAALELMKKQKEQRAKQRERAKSNPESAEKAKLHAEKARVRTTLLARKAREAGIVVTDEEIDAYIAAKPAA